MTKVLIDFINDVIDKTTRDYQLILGKTKEETDTVQESYKFVFVGMSMYTGMIITLMSTLIIHLITGSVIIFEILIFSLFLLFKRQQRLRRLNDAYGEHISTLGQKKDHFLKIRKEIHYWEYITTSFPSNVVRNSLIALEAIDHAYSLYNIGIYEKLFPLLTADTKKTFFWGLLIYLKNSTQIARELQRVGSKALPFFIHDEIDKIIDDNRKYIPKYFMESLAKSNYEIYVNSKDYIEFRFGGIFKFIKKYGFMTVAHYLQNIKPYEMLLDENFDIKKLRLKNTTNKN